MSEKKFKVGYRVRYINPIPHYLEDYIERGDECIVPEVTDCGYYVTKTCESLTIESDELEHIEPTDPRTAFLRELKELLSKYNATIFNATIFGLEIWASINGEQCVFENAEHLDSDNIMDYEKE